MSQKVNHHGSRPHRHRVGMPGIGSGRRLVPIATSRVPGGREGKVMAVSRPPTDRGTRINEDGDSSPRSLRTRCPIHALRSGSLTRLKNESHPGAALGRTLAPVERNCDGVWPVHRLKAKVKALTSWKPRSQATCDTESVASRR